MTDDTRTSTDPSFDDASNSAEAVGGGSGGSLTLERGLRLLALLGESPRGLSVSEISQKMDTHRAGVYRLIRPLAAAHLVERAGDGRYSLGLGLVSLAGNVRSDLQEVAARELELLANRLGHTCALTIRQGEEGVVAIVQEPLLSRMHIAYRRGLRHPLTQAASGLAILAGDDPRPGERIEVTEGRANGYVITQNELFNGATGIAVPIPSAPSAPALASISVVWLGTNLEESRAVAELHEAASRIAAALGAPATGAGRRNSQATSGHTSVRTDGGRRLSQAQLAPPSGQ